MDSLVSMPSIERMHFSQMFLLNMDILLSIKGPDMKFEMCIPTSDIYAGKHVSDFFKI